MFKICETCSTFLDLNDNSPSFSANPYGFNADEDTSINVVIGTVVATDADFGSAGLYALSGLQYFNG